MWTPSPKLGPPVTPAIGSWDDLVDLFLRPEVAIRRRIENPSDDRPLKALWLAMVATHLSTMDNKLAGGNPAAAIETAGQSWGTFFAAAAGMGVITFVLAWFLLGGWYVLRLSAAGAPNVDNDAGRSTYAWVHFVGAFPILLWTAFIALWYHDPISAARADVIAGWTLVVVAIWPIWISYRAATEVFGARRGAALFWFVGLPVAWDFLLGATILWRNS